MSELDKVLQNETQENVVDSQIEKPDDASVKAEVADGGKGGQSKDEQQKYAAARREAEAEKARMKADLDAWAKRRGFNSIEELRAEDEKYLAEMERAKLAAEAAKTGKDPGLYAEEKELLEWAKQKRAEEKAEKERKAKEKEAQEKADKDVADFKDKYPDVNVDALLTKHEKFRKFSKGKVGLFPLTEIYEEFLDFITETEAAAIAKIESKQERATGSSRSAANEGTFGLTDAQIALARENGMSLKEYADFMKHIKK